MTYFVPIFLAVYLGTDVVQSLVAMIPAWLTDGLNLAAKFLTAYGIALLLSTMMNNKLVVYFLLGFFIVAYLNLGITAVAIFACILAYIVNSVKSAPATTGGAQAADDYDPLEDDDDL